MRSNPGDAVLDSAFGKLYSILQTVMGVSGPTGKFIVESQRLNKSRHTSCGHWAPSLEFRVELDVVYSIKTKHITVSAESPSSLRISLPSIASENIIRPLYESFWDQSRGSLVLRVAFAVALSNPRANEVHAAFLQPSVSDLGHSCFVLR